MSKEQVKHTPGEWTHRNLLSSRIEIIGGNKILAELVHYDKNIDEANAEFIVRACNSHEELLKALKKILRRIDTDDSFEMIVDDIVDISEQTIAKVERKG